MTIEPQPPSLDALERMIGNIQTIQHQLEATIPSPGPQPEGWEDPIFDPKVSTTAFIQLMRSITNTILPPNPAPPRTLRASSIPLHLFRP